MRRRLTNWVVYAMAVVAGCLAASLASAQQSYIPCLPPLPYCRPAPGFDAVPAMPGAEGALAPSATGTTDTTGTTGATGMGSTAASSFTELASGAGVGTTAALDPGYIDSAVPRTQFRLRFGLNI